MTGVSGPGVILDEQHLPGPVEEHKSTFNCARPHQGIEQCIPCRMEQREEGPVNARLPFQPVLNGLHHDYPWLPPKGGLTFLPRTTCDARSCAIHGQPL